MPLLEIKALGIIKFKNHNIQTELTFHKTLGYNKSKRIY